MSIQQVLFSYKAAPEEGGQFPHLYIANTTVLAAASGDIASGFYLHANGLWQYYRSGAWNSVPSDSGLWRDGTYTSDDYEMRMTVTVGSDSTIECNKYQPRNSYNWQSPTFGAWFTPNVSITCYAHTAHTPPATFTETVRIQVRLKANGTTVSDSTILFDRD